MKVAYYLQRDLKKNNVTIVTLVLNHIITLSRKETDLKDLKKKFKVIPPLIHLTNLQLSPKAMMSKWGSQFMNFK